MAQPPNNLPIEPKANNAGIPPMKPTVPSAPRVPPEGSTVKPPIAPPPSSAKPTPSLSPTKAPEIKAMPKNTTTPSVSQRKQGGEPEDIFAGIESSKKGLGSKTGTEAPLGQKKKGGAGKVILILFITLLVLGALGFTFWFFVLRGTNKASVLPETQNTDTKNTLFFFKQKTAYEIYQCDWSSDVCSSDLAHTRASRSGIH